jgi:tetratricopeptide (TPR) repeat protein
MRHSLRYALDRRKFRLCRQAMFLATLEAAILSVSLVSALAQDTVYLVRDSNARGPEVLTGKVIDFTGRGLSLRLADGRTQAIRPERIDHVETTRSAEHKAGDELFADGDFRQAIAQYRAAVQGDREVRGWVRRQILSQTVWCQRASGAWDEAGETFLTLAARDPDTPYFDCIPLAWTAARPAPALESNARRWLDQPEPLAALLGASHLLSTGHRAIALARLESLRANSDPRIAWLAEAQTWRAAGAAARKERAGWRQRLEASPQALCAGPYYVFGLACVVDKPDEAALALLKIPILYPRERSLAAAALLTAGGCLERLERPAQAATLYREVVAGAGSLSEADEAQRRLQSLAGATAQ